MKLLLSFTAAVSLTGVSAASLAMESCPPVSEIKQIAPGVYRSVEEFGEWLGTLQGAVEKDAPVQSFEMALVIQEKESAPQRLQHCTYINKARKKIDMRRVAISEINTITTVGNSWKKELGPFGLIYSVCENTAPENCKLTIL